MEFMKRILIAGALVIGIILIFTATSPVEADVKDLYCYMEATTVDVVVKVWDLDNQGNKRGLIWQGKIKKGQRQIVRPRFGRIRYSSSIVVERKSPLSGDISRGCEDGESIGVP